MDDGLVKDAMRAREMEKQRASAAERLRLLEQSGVRKVRGKVQWEGDLNESRQGRCAEQTEGDDIPGSRQPWGLRGD